MMIARYKRARRALYALIASSVLIAQPVWADNASALPEKLPPGASHYPAEPIKKIITDILANPEFETQKAQKNLRYIGKPNETDPASGEWARELAEFVQYLASFFEFLLWLCAFIVVVLVIVYRDRWLRLFSTGSSFSKSAIPEMLFGLDIRQESLPADIPAEVMSLWARGKAIEAISLLYRGTLAMLIAHHGVAITASATEGECIQRVNDTTRTELAQYFVMLTHIWQITVYAHRLPQSGVVQTLCEGFRHHFERPLS